jgi:hypothetical protein
MKTQKSIYREGALENAIKGAPKMNFDLLFDFYQRLRPSQLVVIENTYSKDLFNVLRGGRIFLKDIPKKYADDMRECIAEKRIPSWLIYTWTGAGTGWYCDSAIPVPERYLPNVMSRAAHR